MRRTYISGFAAVIILASTIPFSANAALPEGLVFLVTFEEKDGDVVKDLSGFNNDGEVVGKAEWVTGKYGGGFHFNGSTHITVPNVEPLSALTQPMSAGAWVNPDSLSGNTNIVEMDGNAGWKLGFLGGANVVWTTYHVKDFTSAGTVSLDEWTHVAATWDGSEAIIYINGEPPEPSIAGGGVIDVSREPSLDIGYRRTSGSSYFVGAMDDVFVFDRVLSQAEIEGLMSGFSLAVEPESKLTTTWGSLRKL
jgi:hypothetical protein